MKKGFKQKSEDVLKEQIEWFVNDERGGFSDDEKKLLIDNFKKLVKIKDLDNLPADLPIEIVKLIEAKRGCYLEFLRGKVKEGERGEKS